MLKKTITYENPFTGTSVTEDHYFHISKADLVEMEMEEHKAEYTNAAGEKLTGMQAKLARIVDSEDGKAIMAEFKDIIRRSYGRKDGDRFLKSQEIWQEFAATEAFSQLLFEICTDANAAGDFISGVVPHNLEQIADDVRKQATDAAADGAADASGPNRSQRRASGKGKGGTTARDKATAGLNGGSSDDSAEPRVLTRAEAAEMDADELSSGITSGRYKLS